MRILRISKPIYVLLLSIFYCVNSNAQTQKNNLITESKIKNILLEKQKINTALISKERYKIQIFNGDFEKSKKVIYQFKEDFNDIDATIVFKTPNYKVYVGSFKTRMEAERNLVEIKKKYKNVLLIKPGKQ